MQVRRVVTGTSSDGKAVFASDSNVEGITLDLLPGYEWHRLWGGDGVAELPDAGGPRPPLPSFPDVGGFRFGLLIIPPDSISMPDDLDLEGALAEMESKLPGLSAHQEWDNPGMHTTDTVDEYIVSGRLILEVDDGATVELGPGDTVIQNGTRHAWRNPFDEPCQMVVVNVGARRNR